jgi:transketolase
VREGPEDKSAGLSGPYAQAFEELRERLATERPKLATRQASQLVLDSIASSIPGLVGGSADLTHSNLTQAKSQRPVKPGAFAGDYVYYGIREHGMAAAMSGLVLHGGSVAVP